MGKEEKEERRLFQKPGKDDAMNTWNRNPEQGKRRDSLLRMVGRIRKMKEVRVSHLKRQGSGVTLSP